MAVMAVNFFEFTDLVGLVLTTVGPFIVCKVYPKKHRTLQNIWSYQNGQIKWKSYRHFRTKLKNVLWLDDL